MSNSNGTSIVASYPDDWGFELFVYYNYTGFNISTKVDKVMLIEGENWNPIITTDNPNVVWYYDANYQYPIKTTQFSPNFAIIADEGKNTSYGTLYLYGRIEIPPVKVLDESGVKVLFDLLSLQDYPNNDVLMAVINAIDETKLDKNILKGTNELKWDGKTLDNISVGWYMHLVTYDIPNGFLWVDKGTGSWNDRVDSQFTLIPFSGDGYIGLSSTLNPDSISNIWALAILKENVNVFGTNFSIPGFYLNADSEYGEYVSPLCYEWNLINEKADKEDLVQPDWNETDETSLAYIKNKPELSTMSSHISNSAIHITDEERAIWNAKLDNNKIFVGTYAEYDAANNRGEIPIGAVVILTDID